LDLGVIIMREKRGSKAVAVALKETSVAASTTTTSLAGAECKPSGPCSGGCACEADKAAAVVAQKQQQGAAEEEEQQQDVAVTGAEEAVVDVERLQKELLDLIETLLAEVTYPFDVTSFSSVWIVVWKTSYVEFGGAEVGRTG
jgi:hypothetical protein